MQAKFNEQDGVQLKRTQSEAVARLSGSGPSQQVRQAYLKWNNRSRGKNLSVHW